MTLRPTPPHACPRSPRWSFPRRPRAVSPTPSPGACAARSAARGHHQCWTCPRRRLDEEELVQRVLADVQRQIDLVEVKLREALAPR